MKDLNKEKIIVWVIYLIGMSMLVSVADGLKETVVQFIGLILAVVGLDGIKMCKNMEKDK